MSAVDVSRRVHRVTPLDAMMFLRVMREFDLSFVSEQFASDSYLDLLIEKPWGHEYRVFSDNFYDVWKLCILPGQATSLHCHPRKETALLCLGGTGRLQFLGQAYEVEAGEFVSIGKGVFHSTENVGETDLHLIEVELPRNKLDLVRSRDAYGRQGGHYEKKDRASGAFGELERNTLVEGARIRNTCLENTYHFALEVGAEVIRKKEVGRLLFVVPIDLINAIEHSIQVYSTEHVSRSVVDRDGLYLTISLSRS